MIQIVPLKMLDDGFSLCVCAKSCCLYKSGYKEASVRVSAAKANVRHCEGVSV